MIILETERLYFRHYREGDMRTLHPIFSDSETMNYYPAPFSFEQTQNWIKRNQERYEEDGKTEVEIGYHINKKYWSKGFASTAAEDCRNMAFTN
jgi:ribosomal-protein-alanine N-acetyltransferase